MTTNYLQTYSNTVLSAHLVRLYEKSGDLAKKRITFGNIEFGAVQQLESQTEKNRCATLVDFEIIRFP